MRKRLVAGLITLCVMLMISTAAFAGPATDTVKSKQSELFALIAKPKNEARQDKLRSLFDEVLAYDVLARGSLGKKWDTLSSAQQTKFSGLLTQLVRNNYKRNLENMLDYEIRYVGEETDGSDVIVKTRGKHKTKEREPEIEIDFRMRKVDGKLMIVDIITERASMVKTYRSQFLRILRKNGFDTLIEKMQKKLDKMDD